MAESQHHLSCQELVELVTDYLDGGLEPHRTSLFEQHLNFCEGCVWHVDQVKATIGAIGRIEEEEVPPEALERLMSAFRDWKLP